VKEILISEDVIPIGEFKKQASRFFRRVKEDKRPILVTQNGTPVGVVIPAEEYDRIQGRARFIAGLKEGLRQSDAGEILSSDEVDRELDKEFGPLKKTKTR